MTDLKELAEAVDLIVSPLYLRLKGRNARIDCFPFAVHLSKERIFLGNLGIGHLEQIALVLVGLARCALVLLRHARYWG
jgi:hypothetical protein